MCKYVYKGFLEITSKRDCYNHNIDLSLCCYMLIDPRKTYLQPNNGMEKNYPGSRGIGMSTLTANSDIMKSFEIFIMNSKRGA